MKAGDHARFLVSRGANPSEGADLSVSAAFHRQEITRVRTRTCVISTSTTAIITVLVVMFLDIYPVSLVRSPEASDMALIQRDAADLGAVLASDPQDGSRPAGTSADRHFQDQADAVPARREALHALLSRFTSVDRSRWPSLLADIQTDATVTPIARAIVEALRLVPKSELVDVPVLVKAIMVLHPGQRLALERAGFPAIPQNFEDQEIYVALSTVNTDARALIGSILTNKIVTAQVCVTG